MDFQSFSKISRLSRDCVITEKIDGTNGQIYIENQKDMIWVAESLADCEKYILAKLNGYNIYAGSKNRWLDISSQGDNHGFAKWVQANAEELLNLGEGRHYGEWWGKGIQRDYGLDVKRFSLFNVGRWVDSKSDTPLEVKDKRNYAPECCSVVPILYQGMFDTRDVEEVLEQLKNYGSDAVPGYMNPEGIVVYHTASGKLFKKTIMNDEKWKGK